MNPFSPNVITARSSGWGCLWGIVGVALLLKVLGWQGVVNGLALVVLLLFLAPMAGFFALRWWLKRKLVESPCPVCNYEFTGFEGQTCRCPNCGEELVAFQGQFERPTPPGTIDVDAVDVSVKVLEES